MVTEQKLMYYISNFTMILDDLNKAKIDYKSINYNIDYSYSKIMVS